MNLELDKYFMRYQVDFIADESSLVIVEKGRQIGLSYAAAYKAVRLSDDCARRELDVWVGSRDEIQARQFLIHCQHWAKTLNRAAEAFEQAVLLREGKSIQVHVLKFANELCIAIVCRRARTRLWARADM